MTPRPPITRQQVVAQLWRDGDLEYLLHGGQVQVLKAFASNPARRFVLECARRWGKSWMACVVALMFALQRPKAQIRYAAPTGKMVRKIILPIMRELLEDCPANLRPTWNSQEGVWRFPNGSEIHIAGCDNGGADSLRGTSCDLAIVDEAGFVDDLHYLVTSVLWPQLLTVDGRMLLVSTPATSPEHAFTAYCVEAETSGAHFHATVYDAPHITGEMVEEYQREAGGADSAAWQREGMAMRVTDPSRVIIPEWAALEPVVVVDDYPRPEYFHTWVSGDLGFIDLAVFALAYVDFKESLLIVEDEVEAQRSKSTDLNVKVARKERELGYVGERSPRLRVIDATAITVADMDERVNVATGERAAKDEKGFDVHPMLWQVASKDDADAALNALRVGLRGVRIHRRCKTIISHCRHGIWNKARSSYERIEVDGVRHHFDGIDALKYLVRHADVRLNPYPLRPPGLTADNHHIPPMRPTNGAAVSGLFRRS
jgi:hypothetical protein